jgi:glycosyltransferase involved in cell wall biosynthesis
VPSAPPISFHPSRLPLAGGDARFTVVIPTWNNLPLLQLCLGAIRRHSAFPHQVVLHVNDGRDGTLDWVRSQGLDHTWSRENAGICLPVNAAASLARTDWVVYMNDDMVPCPGWDAALWEAAGRVGHTRCFLSSTMLEPKGRNPAALPPQDFGRDATSFREADLLAALPRLHRPDWSGASWPPSLVHRSLWQLVGGYSAEFSPGAYSDPDFAMKLWRAGVRDFRGVGRSIVYHFRQQTLRRLVANDGRRQFARKWGMTARFFYEQVLRMGREYAGPLPELETVRGLTAARLLAARFALLP